MIDIIFIFCMIIICLFFKLYSICTALMIIFAFYIINQKKDIDYIREESFQPDNKIHDFTYYTDIQDSYKTLVRMIQQATSRIYYSAFAANMTTPFYEQHTLQSLLNEAASRGVYIHIFYNTTAEYTNQTISELQSILDPSIHITTITAEKQLPKSLQSILHQKAYSYNHQKFLVCDDTILFGGTDIDPWERKGYNTLNKNNFYWHEVSLAYNISNDFITWIHQFKNSKKRQIKDLPPPPKPYVNRKSEIDTMLYMIQHSNDIIYVEHQLFGLTKFSQLYSKAIVQAFATRLKNACELSQNLDIYFITNVSQDDEYNFFAKQFSSNTLILTICHILQLIPRKYKQQAKQKLHIYTLARNNKNIKVHSNVFITDDNDKQYHLIRTSSNLSDRSFGKQPCDIELGVYVSGPNVKNLLDTLIQLHTNGNDHIKETGQLHKINITCDAELVRSNIMMLTQTHPASGYCNHNMNIQTIQ